MDLTLSDDPFGNDPNGIATVVFILIVDIDIDPIIEELKRELRFVFEKIDVFDSLVPGV